MRVMKGKRASAHFEMIMSFVFFVGFIVFLFTIIKPYDATVLSEAVLDGLFDSFQDAAHTNLTTFFLKAASPAEDCFYVTLSPEVFRYDLTYSKVFDLEGNEIASQLDGSTLHLGDNTTHYRVGVSPDFVHSAQPVSCSTFIGDYEIGSVLEREVFSLSAMQSLENAYIYSYDNLRQTLGVPTVYDFSITSEDLDISMESTVPDTGDILAKEFIVEVLNQTSGTLVNARINLRVW